MESYLDAKLMLFDGRNGGAGKRAVAVVNADDAAAPGVEAAARRGGMSVHRFGAGAATTPGVRVERVVAEPGGLALTLVPVPAGAGQADRPLAFTLPMLGRYNAWNAAGAAAAALALGLDPATVVAGLAAPIAVPGRLERVETGQPFAVVVDYAHTPDALERALAAVREHFRGRVIVVFGCGGDRDAGKRPLMGRVAAERADRVWITNDNPRGEDPAAIAAAIRAGAGAAARPTPIATVLDRRAAIDAALGDASSGDVVLIAGKGHETTQTIGGIVHPFDDRVVARERLAARGWRGGSP
jgi:UDP-N-acetylmuramoyl-L-alanyl-D-glutamate--2,6-diaminopimelate ligase